MSEYGYLDEFSDRAEGKVPEGDHHVIASKVDEAKTWDDGGTTVRVSFTVPAYNGRTVDCSMPLRLPTKEEAAAAEKSMESSKFKLYMVGVRTLRTLAENYGVPEPSRITVGTEFDVKVIITKVSQHPITGAKKGGWPRIVAFLAPGTVKRGTVGATHTPDGQAIPNF